MGSVWRCPMPKPYSLRRRWTIADARPAVAEPAASGLPLDEFARREGLKVERLRRWRQRLGGERRRSARAHAPELIEIRQRAVAPIEIVLASGRILRISETIDVSVISRLIAAL